MAFYTADNFRQDDGMYLIDGQTFSTTNRADNYLKAHPKEIPGSQVTPTPPPFDEQSYLANNPDVLDAVIKGDYTSGYDHYTKVGKNEPDKNRLADTYTWITTAPGYTNLSAAEKKAVIEKIKALPPEQQTKTKTRVGAIVAHPNDTNFIKWLDTTEGQAALTAGGDVFTKYVPPNPSGVPKGFVKLTGNVMAPGSVWLDPKTGREYDANGTQTNAPLMKKNADGSFSGVTSAGAPINLTAAEYNDYFAKGNGVGDWSPYVDKAASGFDWQLPAPPDLSTIKTPTLQDYIKYNKDNPLPDWTDVAYNQTSKYGDKTINGLGLASYQDQVMTPMSEWDYAQTPAYKAKMALQGEQLANGMNARGINSSQVAANANADLGRRLTAEDYTNEYNRALGLNTGNYTATDAQYGKAFAGNTAADIADYTARMANANAGYSADVNQYNSGINAMGLQSTADANAYNLNKTNLVDQYNINLGAYKDLYNTQTAEADAAYNKMLNATKIGAGAAASATPVYQNNANTQTKITLDNGNASGTAANTQATNTGSTYNGLGTVAGNLFKTIGLT